METKKELQTIVNKARAKLYKIEASEDIAENEKYVGKHFRYRNTYGGPDKEKDKWWLYLKITGISSTGWLNGYSFQNDKQGKINIETKELIRVGANIEYEQITAGQFNKAWRQINKQIEAVAK